MDNAWFDNPSFRNICIENHIEPMMNNGRLFLICPKLPDEKTAEALKGLIPKEVDWRFAEGMSSMIMAAIKVMLAMFGVPSVAFGFGEGGRVILDLPPLRKSTATQPGSPLWNQVASLIQRDPFTQSWQIRVDGEVYRDSEGYSKPDPIDGVPEDFEDEEDPQPVHQGSPLLTAAKKVKPPEIKDDRFDYDKEFLPKDVGTDVKILLESCQSVEEFLKNI